LMKCRKSHQNNNAHKTYNAIEILYPNHNQTIQNNL